MAPEIETFFGRYAAALSSDDVPAIVSCFDPPTFIVDDAATTVMIDRAQLTNHFTGMAERYRARGAFSAAARVHGAEQLAPTVWLVDVSWDSFDENGRPSPVAVERYWYILRTEQSAEPLIVAAIVTRP